MNTREAAQSNLERASLILEEASRFRDRGVWNLVVRRCQEAVELALKGALLWAGLEVPWVHDAGVFLRQHPNRFPADFARQIPRLASISRALSVGWCPYKTCITFTQGWEPMAWSSSTKAGGTRKVSSSSIVQG